VQVLLNSRESILGRAAGGNRTGRDLEFFPSDNNVYTDVKLQSQLGDIHQDESEPLDGSS
jgi:hypothetical protein